MIRNAPRRRVLFVVVIALVGLNILPIDECDDYEFLGAGAVSAQMEITAGDPDGSTHAHVCSCIVCLLTTNDTFAPRLPAPRRGELVTVVAVEPSSSTDLSGIYHPPNA